jgi:hypothetical protein
MREAINRPENPSFTAPEYDHLCLVPGVGVEKVIFMLNARRMNSTTTQNMCLGFQNTKDHYLGLHWTGETARDGTVMQTQTRRQRDLERDHQSNTLIRRPRSTQHSKRTVFRVQVHSHGFQQERIKSAQDHWLAPYSWRAVASEAQVAAHCRNTQTTKERKQPNG